MGAGSSSRPSPNRHRGHSPPADSGAKQTPHAGQSLFIAIAAGTNRYLSNQPAESQKISGPASAGQRSRHHTHQVPDLGLDLRRSADRRPDLLAQNLAET